MNKILLIALSFMLSLNMAMAQTCTTIFDFETDETSVNFQMFGGSNEGGFTAVIDNPNSSGINTTAKVVEYTKAADSPPWGGMFTVLSTPIDGTNGGKICVNVHMDHIGNLALKLEEPVGGGENWINQQSNTKMNEWEQLCFDLSENSFQDGMLPAKGRAWGKVVMFFDFSSTDEALGLGATSYFDDIALCADDTPSVTCNSIFDFEASETSVDFQTFGGGNEGGFTTVIDNPNSSGINTSAKVVEYTKAADAPAWGGMFAALPSPIDGTSGGKVCVDVHMDHIGNLAVKLEEPVGGGENWINQQSNTKMNEWEQLCFDLSEASFQDSKLPANDRSWGKLVLFFDFSDDVPMGLGATTYFDNIQFCQDDSGPQSQDVSFAVDMNNYTGSFTNVFVSGSFNDWSGGADQLTDDDMDGIYTLTKTLNNGSYEYKFTLDDWAVQEVFDPSTACTNTTYTETDVFTNRLISVNSNSMGGDTTCFNSCYACGASAKITFNVGTSAITPSEEGIFLAGGAEFGAPNGRFQLKDDDGDGVYSITIEREKGYESFYTFTNGACDNFSCKENIKGQDCARADNFDDRFLGAVSEDLTINTCFGQCSSTTDCAPPPAQRTVVFNVDMNGFAGDFTKVYVSGSFNNWSGDGFEMTDADGDKVYTDTLSIADGDHEFKYTLDNWTVQEMFTAGDPCTVTNGDFTNRLLTLTADSTLCFGWNSCDACMISSTNNLVENANLFDFYPNPTDQFTTLTFEDISEEKQIQLFNVSGQLIEQQKVVSTQTQFQLNTSHLPKGLYFINVQTEEMTSTKKLIKL